MKSSSEEMQSSLLQFAPFTSFVNSSFWYKMVELKIDEDMLTEVTRHLTGFYSHSDKCGSLSIDCSSFNVELDGLSSKQCTAHGYHLNTNTIEGFKHLDKYDLLTKYGSQLTEDMRSENIVRDPSKLVRFILLTFADLKKYSFTYWFAFPAALDVTYCQENNPKDLQSCFTPEQVASVCLQHKKLNHNQTCFFSIDVENDADAVIVRTIYDFVSRQKPSANDDGRRRENTYVAFLDPSNLDNVPGWPLRNLLSLLRIQCGEEIFHNGLKIISIRGEYSNWIRKSVVYTIRIASNVFVANIRENVGGDDGASDQIKYIGWEKNSKGKLSPRYVNLADTMDPAKLSARYVDLNLKLVKWRLQPDLDLSITKNTSCLLLGAGTLGCSVARVLLAWGIGKITFVDCGTVSYSNPIRQSLFVFDDCPKSVPKATTAAATLKRIHPGVDSEGVILSIAMPGHRDHNMDDIRKLKNLIESHDVTFLLTDSRESRWLPTLICTAAKKVAITIALGYDSFVVIRHGISGCETEENKLACYFCNDIVAPGNSQTDRTLDQQCTISRPGISNIASSLGVELLMSLLQHPKKGFVGSEECSCLGRIPHSIRGFIADFNFMFPSTPSFNQCVACSSTVVEQFKNNMEQFLTSVFSDSKYLENVTSLSQYHLIDDAMEFPSLDDLELDDGE